MKVVLSVMSAAFLLFGCSGDQQETAEPIGTTDDMNMAAPPPDDTNAATPGSPDDIQVPDAPGSTDGDTGSIGDVAAAAEATDEAANPSGGAWRVIAHSLRVRNAPSMNADILRFIKKDETVTAYEEKNGWVRISENNEWVGKRWLEQ